MPIVLRKDGFVFAFYSNDHAPAHVHVKRAGTRCRILLKTLLVTHNTMKPTDRANAIAITAKHRTLLVSAWKKFEAQKRGNR